MKIGSKLAISFVALAVLPLAAASAVYLHSTLEFGQDMAERGRSMLAARLTDDLRRATEHGAVSIESLRRRIEREVRFLASDVAQRMETTSADSGEGVDPGFLMTPSTAETAAGADKAIDLERMSVRLGDDASRDQLAGTLSRLDGLIDVARTVYLRNRSTISAVTVALESGVALDYPAGVADGGDPRESNWYPGTLENGEAATFLGNGRSLKRIDIAAPIALADGRLAGVARISVRLEAALALALNAAQLPPEATAHLIVVPSDDPALTPHEVATLAPEDRQWRVHDRPRALTPDGDDAWLKVISDLRSGVPGLEYVEHGGQREAWAFGPVGRTPTAALHIAAVFPERLIEDAGTRAEGVVRKAYERQMLNALAFAAAAAAIAVLLALFGARTLTRPIRRLHEAAGKLARGDFSVRVDAAPRDELGDLARGFNRMVPALEEQLRVKRDLHVAREIQQHLVPKSAPSLDGFDIAGTTVYCNETGGDYQDYIPLENGKRMAAVIGDVTGHGVGAALLMATARASLRANAQHTSDPGELMGAVNRHLAQDSSGGRFLTMLFLSLEPGARTLQWISAGHERAFIYDPAADAFTALEGDGIPLGVDADWTFHAADAEIPEGGLLVAYTDGIREASNKVGENYGVERLKTAVRAARQRGADAVCEHVLADLQTFRDGAEVGDDVSILVIRPV